MSFIEDLDQVSLDIVEFGGYEAVLTRAAGGDPVNCHIECIKSPESIPEGFSALVTASQLIIGFCLYEIETAIVRGDSVVIAAGPFAGSYIIEAEQENDGYFQRMIVK